MDRAAWRRIVLPLLTDPGESSGRLWVRPLLSLSASAVLLAGLVVGRRGAALPSFGPLEVAVMLVTAMIPFTRLWWPGATLAVAGVVALLMELAIGTDMPVLAALAIALYTYLRRGARTSTIVAVSVLIAGVLALIGYLRWGDDEKVLPVLFLFGFAAAAADASRSRAEHIAAIVERAERAEAGRDAEARRRVAEDRLQIARDLHDSLAHQIAVVNLHAGAAERSLRERPEDAERSLAVIREAASTVLREMNAILSVLRDRDRVTAAVPDGPVATLADLDQLLVTFRAVDFQVEAEATGLLSSLPEPVGIIGLHVVQEALTNAHKHGSDQAAALNLDVRDDELVVTVANQVSATSATVWSGGHGLVGLRERVGSLGGTIEAGVVDVDRFVLTCRIPLVSARTPR